MAVPVVWSERDEPTVAGWHDCTYSSGLMALVGAAYTDFPEGIYTVAERELLERSDTYPDEQGSRLVDLDAAVKFRYGKTFHKLTDRTATGVRNLLNTPGRLIVLQGSYADIPYGHMIRRWQPNFTGGHAVCVMTRGDGSVLWLDPLATWRYKGDIVSVDLAMKFAYTGGDYQRYLSVNEFASLPDTATEEEMTLQFTIIQYALPRRIHCRPATDADKVKSIKGYLPPVHEVVKSLSLTRGSWFSASGEVKVKGWDKTNPDNEWEYWLAADGFFGPDNNGGKSLWVSKSPLCEPSPMPTLDCSVEVREAVDPLNVKIQTQTQTIATLKTELAEAEKTAADTLTRAEDAEDRAKAVEELAKKATVLQGALKTFLS